MTEFCCEAFKGIQDEIGWCSYDLDDENETKVYLMPYIESHKDLKEVKYRINFCPSCGKDIRDIKIIGS